LVELEEGVLVQWLATYILKWPKGVTPEVGFVEAEENADLREALEEIQAEARSSLPVDGLYADMAQFYREKVRRIATLATRALDGAEEKHEPTE